MMKHCDIDVKVFTSEPCQAMRCDECEGIYNKDKPVSEWIFCTHECHLKRNRDYHHLSFHTFAFSI